MRLAQTLQTQMDFRVVDPAVVAVVPQQDLLVDLESQHVAVDLAGVLQIQQPHLLVVRAVRPTAVMLAL